MDLIVQRRAEVALRSLALAEQTRVISAIEKLRVADLHRRMHVVKLSEGGPTIYVYRATPRLRLLLSRDGDTWSVDDIVDHDRLERTILMRSQQ